MSRDRGGPWAVVLWASYLAVMAVLMYWSVSAFIRGAR